ncbi:hypothetical protein BD410DRAFT_608003 [Rickenella mellea]|uniref:Uncharacterized protein n=1 Tax=Rickenella mellea TaxID=50990 RepID=A0A4Y7QFC2_9AGAM|nr:hypothetical protein BD410DRAFT_608003 [Rickenella mellea]
MSSEYEIILYDIPSTLEEVTSSPNVWRTKLLLNYKKLSYKTIWVHFDDLEATCKSIGAAPTSKKPDGSDSYTFPVISVKLTPDSTPIVVSDSPKIASFIEEKFPDPERPLFPEGSRALQAALRSYLVTHVFFALVPVLMEPYIATLVKPDYYASTRQIWFKVPLDQFIPKGDAEEEEWKKVEQGFDGVAAFLDENADGFSGAEADEKRLSVLGGQPSYVELELVAFMYSMKRLGFQKGWERLKDRNEGRWPKIMERYKEYLPVH